MLKHLLHDISHPFFPTPHRPHIFLKSCCMPLSWNSTDQVVVKYRFTSFQQNNCYLLFSILRNIEHFSTSNPRKLWNNNRTTEIILDGFSNRKKRVTEIEKNSYLPFFEEHRLKNTFKYSITHRLSSRHYKLITH